MKIIPTLAATAASFLFASFSSAQTDVWQTQFASSTTDATQAMASDQEGNVFQVFTMSNDSSSPPLFGVGLSRTKPNGELFFNWGIIASSTTRPTGLCSDGGDGVFISGGTNDNLGGSSVGGRDAWLAHYDAQGAIRWFKQFGTAVFDSADVIAPDGSGGSFVAGQTNGSWGSTNLGFRDIWVARFDAAGNQLWLTQFGTAEQDKVLGGTLDAAGGFVICGVTNGEALVARFDSSGTMTWTSQTGSPIAEVASAVAADPLGGVFVAGSTLDDLAGQSAGSSDVWLAHYDATGSQTWIRQFGSAGRDGCSIAVPDATGGVLLSGLSNGSLGAGGSSAGSSWLGHFDSAGNEIWLTQFGAAQNLIATVGVPNRRGGVYLGGSDSTGLASGSRWLSRFDDIATEVYCSPAAINSTGTHGKMSASGSGDIAANDVVLQAVDLPANSLGFFLASAERDLITFPSNPGTLCLGSPIGRFTGPGQVMDSGSAGSFSLAIDVTAMPKPNGAVAVLPGESWHFQAWNRDVVGGVATWNFTDAVTVMFR